MLIPAEELVSRPKETFFARTKASLPPSLAHNGEENFRAPQRVCDGCSHQLRALQEDLRLLVARANQETIINTPNVIAGVPQMDFFLENEIRNATIMLHTLRTTQGEENIPRELLELAKGVVFLTMVKAGFMFSGRYGTGLVVAKLADGTWSPPSAVTISGMGWGLQIGAELTEVLLILSTDAAVDAFKSRAQVSIGAELGVSVGPIGRSLASDVSAGNKGAAHAFSYAHSKGLFFGASLEASGVATRPDVNRRFYGQKISPSVLLSGEYPRPRGAQPLYDALDEILVAPVPSTVGTAPNMPIPPPGGSSSSGSGRVTFEPASAPAPGNDTYNMQPDNYGYRGRQNNSSTEDTIL